jgi:hypothetical protein
LLVGILRVRNEALILQDTLDHVGNFVDAVVAYDDASTDQTRAILAGHQKVALLIENDFWEADSRARLEAETRHRGLLLDVVRQQMRCEWVYCFDADERIVGDLRDFLGHVSATECNGVRVRLFDAYLTPDDQAPIAAGECLLGRRRFFGPECRDILMLWRNLSHVQFRGLDAREPSGVDRVVTIFQCQHYGKAISVAEWEATCNYYAKHFPPETYGLKWRARKGQAIHVWSDFGQPLFEWGQELFLRAKVLGEAASLASPIPGEGTRCSVLLATNRLIGWTGSETLFLALVNGLYDKGVGLTVYARHLDRDWAAGQLKAGIRLVDDLDEILALSFNLAHVQHSSCLVDIRNVFPSLPILYSSLGVIPFLEHPPPFDVAISRYLAISEETQMDLISRGVPADRIEIVRNLVCESSFMPTRPISARPESILVLSNKIDDARKVMLRAAARVVGASILFVGGGSGTIPPDQLAAAINTADIVVSLGRGVIEAMLCGRIPIVFDSHGGDGMVTPDNLDLLSRCNFSGRCLSRTYSISDLVAEFGKYRQEDGERLRQIAVEQFGLSVNLPQLMGIYEDVTETKRVVKDGQMQTVAFCVGLAREDLMFARYFQRRNSVLQKEILNQQNEIHRIKHTFSWHITKPLRVIWNMARRLFRLKP